MALVIQSHYRPSTSLFGGKITTPPTLARIHISGTLRAPVEVICRSVRRGLGPHHQPSNVRTLPHFDPVVHLEP